MGEVCLGTPGAPIDWDAIAAVATAIAALIAAVAIYVAVKAPANAALEQRSESTHEVLRAVAKALIIYDEATLIRRSPPVHRTSLKKVAAKAALLKATLDILVDRLGLTDGAIGAGCGAALLMHAIIDEDRVLYDARHNFSADGPNPFGDLVDVRAETAIQSAKVVAYAVRKKWPKVESRFQSDAAISSLAAEGIRLEATHVRVGSTPEQQA